MAQTELSQGIITFTAVGKDVLRLTLTPLS